MTPTALQRIKEIEKQATSVDPGFYEWTPFLLKAFKVMREMGIEESHGGKEYCFHKDNGESCAKYFDEKFEVEMSK